MDVLSGIPRNRSLSLIGALFMTLAGLLCGESAQEFSKDFNDPPVLFIRNATRELATPDVVTLTFGWEDKQIKTLPIRRLRSVTVQQLEANDVVATVEMFQGRVPLRNTAGPSYTVPGTAPPQVYEGLAVFPTVFVGNAAGAIAGGGGGGGTWPTPSMTQPGVARPVQQIIQRAKYTAETDRVSPFVSTEPPVRPASGARYPWNDGAYPDTVRVFGEPNAIDQALVYLDAPGIFGVDPTYEFGLKPDGVTEYTPRPHRDLTFELAFETLFYIKNPLKGRMELLVDFKWVTMTTLDVARSADHTRVKVMLNGVEFVAEHPVVDPSGLAIENGLLFPRTLFQDVPP